jgi:WD40 repeat protein/serine/threonine protein kinase
MSDSGIFKAAVKLPADHRAAYLDQACGNNQTLRQDVESLLHAHEAPGSFLEPLAAGCAITHDYQAITERPGMVIGPYKLLEQIGEGGFGVVFMAEQQQPMRRTVALKLIKPGMDSRQVIARFEAEQQALALMDHPNIAKVLDAGQTSSGRPYFVMEFVKGVPITEFCDQSQLTLSERLELFVLVCQAVQHAHQKAIIHRDIKPSNVLVRLHDGTPAPKIIDFGIAKALGQQLTDKTLHTGLAQLIGTPLYMSPEQAKLRGLDTDTRTDIYSLGVLLYELLTGTTPFDKERFKEVGYDEMRRIICEEEPPKPSTRISTLLSKLPETVGASCQLFQTIVQVGNLPPRDTSSPADRGSVRASAQVIAGARRTDPSSLQRLCRGELDWIVMKALAKDRNRRYGSAEALGDDLRRFLAGEPIHARPVRLWERVAKWVRRHPAPAALALVSSLAALALVGVVVAWSYGTRLAATNAELESAKSVTESANSQLESTNIQLQHALEETGAKRLEADTQRAEAQRQRALAERYLYAAHMALAGQLGQSEETLRLLELHVPTQKHPVDLRGFEWYYLLRLCRAARLPLRGHTAGVLALRVNTDGRRVTSVGADHMLRVWDLEAGREVLTVRIKADKIKAFAFSPDGRRLAGAGLDRVVRVFDAATGQELACCKGHAGPVNCVAFSQDGKHVASGSGNWNEAHHGFSVKVWDARTGAEVVNLAEQAGPVFAVAFSPDGRSLATGALEDLGQPNVQVWDWRAGRQKLSVDGPRPATRALAFSPDGRHLAAAGGNATPTPPNQMKQWDPPGELKAWDVATGREVFRAREPADSLGEVAFSPDGKRVAACGRGGPIKLWDAATGQAALTLRGHTGEATALAFSPAGPGLMSGGADQTVRVWGIAPGPRILEPNVGPLYDVAFSPDGRTLAAIGNRVKLWDAATGKDLLTVRRRGQQRLAFSPGGRRLATGNLVFVAATGRGIATFRGPPARSGSRGVAFSRSGTHIANTGYKAIFVWDAQTGTELFTARGHAGHVLSVAFSPDGKWLASGGDDNTVKLWDAATGLPVHTFVDGAYPVYALAFSPDGTRLAAATGSWRDAHGPGEVKVWDMVARREIFTLRGHTEAVWGVAFSPDGKRLASCSGINTVLTAQAQQNQKCGEIKLWDTVSGQEVLTLRSAHRARIFAVAFSPDGKHLASAGTDGVVKIWDAAPDK